jgi:hypothetical protein
LKTKDVTQFLADMVGIAMYDTDEAGYIIDRGTQNRVLLANDGWLNPNGRPVLLYQEEIKDTEAHILNPLAEGLGQTPSALWFYRMLKASLLSRISTLFRTIVSHALEEKKAGGKEADKEAGHLPLALLNLASQIIEEVDDKSLEELTQFFTDKNSDEFLTIYYQKKYLRSVVSSGLFDKDETTGVPTLRSKFPKIRKKTWGVFERLLFGVLGVRNEEELTKFDRKADLREGLTCYRLSSLLNVLLALYHEINPLLGHLVDRDVAIDLSTVAHHITRLGDYANNAKFMVQPPRGAAVQPSSSVPGLVSTVPGLAPAAVPTTNVSMIPGPRYADGREGPPIAVPVNPVPGYGTPPGFAPSTIPGPAYNPGWPGQAPALGYAQPSNYALPPPFNPPYQQAPLLNGGPNLLGLNMVPGMPSNIWR